jgi:hypothetical protein
MLREEFDWLNNNHAICTSIKEHINQFKKGGKQKRDRIDSLYDTVNLPMAEVDEWFKQQCPPDWEAEKYSALPGLIHEMSDQNKIKEVLGQHGIKWHPDDPALKLQREITHAKLALNAFKSIILEIDEIEETRNETLLQDFLERQGLAFPANTDLENLRENAQKMEVRAALKLQKLLTETNERQLEGIEDTLTPEALEEARATQFVLKNFCDQDGCYTDLAVLTFLTAHGVFELNEHA